ncbi:hypothetical protein MLD38_012428 [Melastoma candidum]|uniref:Uncharacterized protein n=1 Tax=Melastoma candidum TaxID=119954 RepID=A0ACB9RAG4_9MYRT|nr:hypothetical protein MLD38_012428 [Melastoma candidum]
MGLRRVILGTFVVGALWVLLWIDPTGGVQSDVDCLKSIRDTVEDPNNYMNYTWDFSNHTEGSICQFIGVECWHQNENKVLNLKLSNMGLKGHFPLGLQNCSSMTSLDLSNNDFNGSIPSNISMLIPFVTTLDLSSNSFSGEIPENLANCTYLHSIKLDNNQLLGQIPWQLNQLGRLTSFSVANNQLQGPVPSFGRNVLVTAGNYANNLGLCGPPLSKCEFKKGPSANVIAAAAAGGVTVGTISLAIGLFVLMRRRSHRKKEADPEGNKWARSLKGSEGVKVSVFEKSVSKMKLNDLMKATNNFSKSSIIDSGRTGTMYKAILGDDNVLMIKRLQDSQHSEKQLMSELETLGKAKHRNLVPLLGFCMAKNERLLVYRFMPNGTLRERIHPSCDGETSDAVDWPTRLKIGIGAARGLAWLHHNCNPRIIHRNISSKCIFLDTDFEPRLSDFGLARLMNPVDTHLSTFVNGEFGDLGYVAPEYSRTLVATPKGDVYSFGVVLLELVTGEHPTHIGRASDNFKGNLVDWITELTNNARLEEAIDEGLSGKGFDSEVFQFLKVACSCVSSNPKERPTMFEVYQLLRAIGQRYDFSTDDNIQMPTDNGDSQYLEELIVAREETK